MQRIAVIGVSCSGKTTLAASLSGILKSKLIDLDEIHWQPGWVSTPAHELLPKVKSALDCPAWIVSGNYSCLQDIIFNQADTIIWLDYSPFVVAKRALTRTFKRTLFKQACCNGNYETIRQSFFSKNSILLWVLKTYRLRKVQYHNLMNDSKMSQKTFIRLSTPKATLDLLDRLK